MAPKNFDVFNFPGLRLFIIGERILSAQIFVTYFLVDRWSEIALQKKSSLCGRVCLAEKEQKKGIVSGLTAI